MRTAHAKPGAVRWAPSSEGTPVVIRAPFANPEKVNYLTLKHPVADPPRNGPHLSILTTHMINRGSERFLWEVLCPYFNNR